MTAPAPRPGRVRSRLPATWVLAAVLVVAGVLAATWRAWPTAPPPVATDLDRLAPDVAAAIARYRQPRLVLSLVVRGLSVAVPMVLVATGRGRALLARLAGRRHAGWRGPVRGAVVAVAVLGLSRLAALPVQAWAGVVQDGAWQVRTASAAAWWGRVLTSLALELAVVALLGAGLVWLVRRRPRAWPGDAVVLGVAAVATTTLLWPALVLPLTTPVQPLGEGPTADAVRAVVAGAGMGDLPVVVAERSRRDTRSNAVVHGLGPTRRVVIDDTLLARPVSEVRAVMAHELAHQQHGDVGRAVLSSALLVALLAAATALVWDRPRVRGALGVSGVPVARDDPRLVAVALAVAVVAGLVAEPVGLWQSRRVEAAADATALHLGADPATVVRLQRRLAIDNLTPMQVPTWERWAWWSHPTPSERVEDAVAQAGAAGASLPSRADLLVEEAADPPAWREPGS